MSDTGLGRAGGSHRKAAQGVRATDPRGHPAARTTATHPSKHQGHCTQMSPINPAPKAPLARLCRKVTEGVCGPEDDSGRHPSPPQAPCGDSTSAPALPCGTPHQSRTDRGQRRPRERGRSVPGTRGHRHPQATLYPESRRQPFLKHPLREQEPQGQLGVQGRPRGLCLHLAAQRLRPQGLDNKHQNTGGALPLRGISEIAVNWNISALDFLSDKILIFKMQTWLPLGKYHAAKSITCKPTTNNSFAITHLNFS